MRVQRASDRHMRLRREAGSVLRCKVIVGNTGMNSHADPINITITLIHLADSETIKVVY